MTPEAQRIAIAEACGWKYVKVYQWAGDLITPKQWHDVDVLPDYLNDLNAMHEAEKVLLPDLSRYGTELTKVCDQFAAENGYELLESWRTTATASQRAEAFLRTLNLWKE